MKRLSAARAARLLRGFSKQRILVLGDVMLDEFIWGKVSRISPEAPVPVVQVTGHSFHLGGAGNVAANVRAMGGTAVLTGVIGKDPAGERIRESLSELGVLDGLVASPGSRPTTLKTRIIAHHQQVVRADREETDDLAPALEDAVLEQVASALRSCHALVLSDYQKGVVTPRLTRAVLAAARRRRLPVLVDPKVRHFSLYRRVTVVTPNQAEAEQATGIRIRDAESLESAGRRILGLLGCGAALITRGEHGMSLFPHGSKAVHIPTTAREVFDVTGAGDTVIATLALALGAGARLDEAATLANYAAGVVVGKLGTATATPEEILAAVEAGASR